MDIKTVKTIPLLDVVRASGESASGGNDIWDEVSGSHYGNQIFSNDSLFRYALPSLNGEPLTDTQKRIVKLCGEAIEDHIVVFEVSW